MFSLVVFTFPLAFSLLLGVRTAVAALSSSHHGVLPGFVAVLGTPVGFQDGCQHTQIVLVNATFRSVVGMGFLVVVSCHDLLRIAFLGRMGSTRWQYLACFSFGGGSILVMTMVMGDVVMLRGQRKQASLVESSPRTAMEKQRHAEDGDAEIDKVCEAFHGACVFLLYLFFGKSIDFVWYIVVVS